MVKSFKKYLAEEESVSATKRQNMQHLTQMKPREFIDLMRQFRDELNGIISSEKVDVSEKVDGFGIRFGVDDGGKFFIESSRSGPQFHHGAFSAYAKAKFGVADNISAGYDDIFKKLGEYKQLQDLLKKNGPVKVIGECLYNPNATLTDHGLKFIATTYNPKLLGKWATFVLFHTDPDKDHLIDQIKALSTHEIKFATPEVDYNDVDITYHIKDFFQFVDQYPNIKEILASRKAADRDLKKMIIDTFQRFQKDVTDKIASGIEKGQFGPEVEGAVFGVNDTKFKVTTQSFKKNKELFNTEFKAKKGL